MKIRPYRFWYRWTKVQWTKEEAAFVAVLFMMTVGLTLAATVIVKCILKLLNI